MVDSQAFFHNPKRISSDPSSKEEQVKLGHHPDNCVKTKVPVLL